MLPTPDSWDKSSLFLNKLLIHARGLQNKASRRIRTWSMSSHQCGGLHFIRIAKNAVFAQNQHLGKWQMQCLSRRQLLTAMLKWQISFWNKAFARWLALAFASFGRFGRPQVFDVDVASGQGQIQMHKPALAKHLQKLQRTRYHQGSVFWGCVQGVSPKQATLVGLKSEWNPKCANIETCSCSFMHVNYMCKYITWIRQLSKFLFNAIAVSLWFVVHLADGRWWQAVKDLIETKASGDAEKDEPPKKKATGHSMWQMWKDLWDLRRSWHMKTMKTQAKATFH